jgi:hypothetical protein
MELIYEEINCLEDFNEIDPDPDYVNYANKHIENEYNIDDDFSELNRGNSNRSIIIPQSRSKSQSFIRTIVLLKDRQR